MRMPDRVVHLTFVPEVRIEMNSVSPFLIDIPHRRETAERQGYVAPMTIQVIQVTVATSRPLRSP